MSVFDPAADALFNRSRRQKRNNSDTLLAELSSSERQRAAVSVDGREDETELQERRNRRKKMMMREKVDVDVLKTHMDQVAHVGEDDKYEYKGRERMMKKLNDACTYASIPLPSVDIRFMNVSITVPALLGGTNALPSLPAAIQSSASSCMNSLLSLVNCGGQGSGEESSKCLHFGPKTKDMKILNDVSGYVRPGQSTLVLGPPGAGKTVLLKLLSGRMKQKDSAPRIDIEGSVTYNGVPISSPDFCVEQTAAYIEQNDVHIAQLTVRETFEFARRCQGKDPFGDVFLDILENPQAYGIDPTSDPDWPAFKIVLENLDRGLKTEVIIDLLLLKRAADTIVGDAMLRGVSGGERRRVTTGEMLVSQKRVLCCDEISTGLDSASTYTICKALCNATKLLNKTTIISLLQPQPETYDLFDEIILLTDARVVFQGNMADVLSYFNSIGFEKPKLKDTADFLQEVTTPRGQSMFQWRAQEALSIDTFSELFLESEYGSKVKQELKTPHPDDPFVSTSLIKSQYMVNPIEAFTLVLSREFTLVFRDYVFLVGRSLQTTLLGAIVGTLFWQVDIKNKFTEFLGLQFFSLLLLSFTNLPQLALVFRNRQVFYKQRNAHFFSAIPWGVALSVVQIPQQIVEDIVFTSFIYWFSGMAPSAAKYFTYILIIFCNSLAMSGIFRAVASWTPRLEMANAVAVVFLMWVVIMSGFTILRTNIPDYAIWLYWISPLAYSGRALAINEFSAERWSSLCTVSAPDPGDCFNATETFGDYILRSMGIYVETFWIWVAVGFNLSFYLITTLITILGLTYYSGTMHQATHNSDSSEYSASKDSSHNIKMTKLPSSQEVPDIEAPHVSEEDVSEEDNSSTEKPSKETFAIEPVELVFKNIRYFVKKPGTDEEIELLKGITAFTTPSTLTALMGASGAGKSTLMDVIAGRKTTGRITGEIELNGFPKDQKVLRRIMGYVEQTDILSSALTVYETLLFSARLRLPRTSTLSEVYQFVHEQMVAIELDKIRSSIVGLPGASGLSVEQRKRLSIGVELVGNPGIVFMDEPTSGLDARAAQIVMNTVKKIGQSGRSIVCTIHQPSREIFSVFDSLLLLKRGGQTIYFGSLGENSILLTNYLSKISGEDYTPDQNPANYMLDVTCEKTSETEDVIDYAEKYLESDISKAVINQIDAFKLEREGRDKNAPITFKYVYASSEFVQWTVLAWKYAILYWRMPAYNVVRLVVTTILGLVFGAVYWNLGTLKDDATRANVQNIQGALFASVLFIGASNLLSVLPVVGLERLVLYRERAAGMYRAIFFLSGSGLAEFPYVLVQAIVYSSIIYWMVQFEEDAAKFFFYILVLFVTLFIYTSFGTMAVFVSPTQEVTMVLSATALSIWTLFLGFILPRPDMPWYWRWINYITPPTYSMQALVTSQLGDNQQPIKSGSIILPASEYIEKVFDYKTSFQWPSIAILFGFLIFFRAITLLAILLLNFQEK